MTENSSDPWADVTDSVDETKPAPDAEAGSGAVKGGADAGSKPTFTDAREVLDAVAAGKLTAEEAAAVLDELRNVAPEPGAEPRAEAVPTEVDRVRVRAVGRRVRLIGEPFVTSVAVDGPHVVRQEGNTLVVTSEGEFGASLDGFTLSPPRSFRDVQQKFLELGRELAIRVNPDLLVEAEITAGSLSVERLPKLEQVRATAGSVRLRDVEGPLDLLVQAGSAQVEGKIDKGRSRLRTESGSMQLRLLKGSSVAIRSDVQLGRVVWDLAGSASSGSSSSDTDERVIGGGDAKVDLEIVMGQVTVKEAP